MSALWRERTYAQVYDGPSGLDEIEMQVINVQAGDHEKHVAACEQAIRDLVELDNVTVYSQTARGNIRLHRKLTDLTRNTYRGPAKGDGTTAEHRMKVMSYKHNRLAAHSYAEGILLRLKSMHHIPAEHYLTGMYLYRAGISTKSWNHLSSLHIIPSRNTIKEFIQRFIEKPLSMPRRGRIGLAVYDNCAYRRSFMYQRVGEHEKSTINTCTMFEIPIGDLIEFGPNQEIWKRRRQEIAGMFNPNSELTQNIPADLAKEAFFLYANEDGARAEPQKVWEYPKLPAGMGKFAALI
jgi:hypothetical protein